MKLLAKTKHYLEFVSLQKAIDKLEAQLHEVESLLQQKDEALKLVRKYKNEPCDSAKKARWSQRLADYKVNLSFATYAADEALGALEQDIDELGGCVEKARQIYYKASPDLKIMCGLNVLISDSFRSRAKEVLLRTRKTLFNAPAEESGVFGVEFVARQSAQNRRLFTVRFIAEDGSWSYVKADQSDDCGSEIPMVPCMTQLEAREKAVELDLHGAQVYDIVTGFSYQPA